MSYDNDRLGAALKLYLGSNPLPMHMPGHKRNPALITSEFYQDITEIQGFDNLHSPNGLLKDLESAAAVLWKAAGAFISVGGSTAMILFCDCRVQCRKPWLPRACCDELPSVCLARL